MDGHSKVEEFEPQTAEELELYATTIIEMEEIELEDEIRKVETEEGYAELARMQDIESQIFDQLLKARRRIKEAALAYATRKRHLNLLDGTETRQRTYLQAWAANQEADVNRDVALDDLWRLADSYMAEFKSE